MQKAIKSSSLGEPVPPQPPPCTPERFKEICLRPGGDSLKETLGLLEYLFSAETFLDRPLANVSLIKQYLTGGANYDTFKSKGSLLPPTFSCLNPIISRYIQSEIIRYQLDLWNGLERQLRGLPMSYMCAVTVYVNMCRVLSQWRPPWT